MVEPDNDFMVYMSFGYKKTKNDNRKFVNNFELFEEVGQGSFWTVYKVQRNYSDENETDSNFYVFKEGILSQKDNSNIMEMDICDNNELKEFKDEKNIALKELIILKKINYKHIARLYECILDYEKNKIVFVMEICDLGPLMVKDSTETKFLYNYNILNLLLKTSYSDHLESMDINTLVKIAKTIFKQLALALYYLHERFIAHRDLNPNNILFKSDEGGTLKLTDFSISKVYNSTDVVTSNSNSTFEAPEIFEELHNPFKVDIYCFGACLYLFLTNDLEFNNFNKNKFSLIDENLADLLAKVLCNCPKARPDIQEILKHKFFANE